MSWFTRLFIKPASGESAILNGLLHSIVFIIKREYNPGLISGLFLFIPFGIYFLIKMIRVAQGSLLPALLIFVIGASLIPVTIWVTGRHHPLTQPANCFISQSLTL